METYYLTKENFNKELDYCLTIKETHKDYYICEHISAGLYKKDVKIFILTN